MTRVATYDKHDTFATYDLALVANPFHAGSNLHRLSLLPTNIDSQQQTWAPMATSTIFLFCETYEYRLIGAYASRAPEQKTCRLTIFFRVYMGSYASGGPSALTNCQHGGLSGGWGDRQRDGAVLGNRERMLEMGTKTTIGSHLGPLVGQHFDPFCTYIHHRLDGNDKPWLNQEISTAPQRPARKIGDLRILVHFAAYAMPDKALDGIKSVVGHVLSHLPGDLAPSGLVVHLLDGQIENPLGYIKELLDFVGNSSHGVGYGRVAAPTIEHATGVHAHDVAFLEWPIVRDAVDDRFVDRHASDRRKRRLVLDGIGIVEKQGPSIQACKVLGNRMIDLGSRRAWAKHFGGDLMGLPDSKACLAHKADFAC